MTCKFCGKPAEYDAPIFGDCEVDYTTCEHCRRVTPLETTKCYNRVDEGDMDFGKLAKIFEDLPCKDVEEDTEND